MTAIDWVVLVAFLVWVVSDGIRRSRDSQTLEGYFAGSRAIPWWAAGLSVMATQASAITVIGTTSQGHDKGLEFVQFYFGLPFAMVLLCVWLVPLLRRQPILTAYEFLEGRFGPATRTLASAIFLVSRCLAFGVVLYAPAVVLAAMTGWSLTWMVIVIGALTTIYTMLGGVSAVIWTDVKQMVVIIGGLLLAFGILAWALLAELSVGGVLAVAGAGDRLTAVDLPAGDLGVVPRAIGGAGSSIWEDKYNLFSGLLGGLFLHLAYFGCDHSQVQRILTNRSVRESRMALLVSAFAKVPMQAFILFLGVLMFVYHSVGGSPVVFRPVDTASLEPATRARYTALATEFEAAAAERRAAAIALAAADDAGGATTAERQRFHTAAARCDRIRRDTNAALGRNPDTNFVFCHFILNHVPPVLLGLLIAAIFAAAMSSADSALNSLTAATVVDFYRRWIRPGASEQSALRTGRVVTLGWGTMATVAALTIPDGSSIIEFINMVGSFFYGSLLGVFLLAAFCPGAGPRAGFAGLVSGMVAVLAVHWTLEVEFLWYNVVGAVAVLAVGFAIRPFERRR